ncbi:V-set and immunoglobulin domain-containing protein 10 [Sphaerodactylus townsendi]|uniref:V-set and immunoglobulin domain-containing protein 10 n=1 Tax=Sphaerodactylus townsendi TaxID=933632 RepID=UPI0020275C0B|nr:V-set and immunoglobulin domain-containing protein 10 [Sphaerodactylus townsendi]
MARRPFAALGVALLALCCFKGAAGTETVVIGTAGGDVTLSCQNASQRALVVEWFRGDPDTTPILFSSDGTLPDDTRFSLIGNASLHISGLRLQDESNYTCKEVLNETDHLHRIQLLVASGPDRIGFQIHPATPLPNGTLYVKKHDILNFTCTAVSRPVPTIKWDFCPSGSPHELFTEVNSSQNSYILHNMSPRYQGNYTCSAKNPFSGVQATVTQELLVYYPPPSLPQCWVQTSTDNSRGVQLFCQWTGAYPHPTLRWRDREDLSGREINATSLADTLVATLNSSQLFHEKEFTCHGSHILQQEAKATCRVQLVDPSIMSDPVRSCFVGRAVVLTCYLTAGNPPSRITWLRNISQPETEIRSSGRFHVSQEGNTSTLIIQNCSRKTDEGYYVCKAENSVGLREMYIHLTVTEPVNIGGIVGTIVVILLLGILVFFGVFLYAGHRFCPKGTLLRTRDSSDILVLMDSEDEDVLTEGAGDPAWHKAMVRANGHATWPTESFHAEMPGEITQEEKETGPTT